MAGGVKSLTLGDKIKAGKRGRNPLDLGSMLWRQHGKCQEQQNHDNTRPLRCGIATEVIKPQAEQGRADGAGEHHDRGTKARDLTQVQGPRSCE